MRHLITLCISCIFIASPSFAQDWDGNDRPSNWIVTHTHSFGIWESICDERMEDTSLHQRCYIRSVEVFSPRPDFAAQFLFITPDANGFQLELGIEPGTLFDPDGLRIEKNDLIIWKTQRPGCLIGLSCTFTSSDAETLIEAMKTGDAFLFTFVDRHGKPRHLNWSLNGFNDAFADFMTQSNLRGLF